MLVLMNNKFKILYKVKKINKTIWIIYIKRNNKKKNQMMIRLKTIKKHLNYLKT